jgi:hypothetical protein
MGKEVTRYFKIMAKFKIKRTLLLAEQVFYSYIYIVYIAVYM